MRTDHPIINGLAAFVMASVFGGIVLYLMMIGPGPSIRSVIGFALFTGFFLALFLVIFLLATRQGLIEKLRKGYLDFEEY